MSTAKTMAAHYISEFGSDVQLYDDPVIVEEFGWVFAYQSAKYFESGDIRDALVGNVPLLIDKHTAELIPLGTAHSVEYYANNYIQFGDPFITAGPIVEVHSYRSGANKVQATTAIRNHSGLGLKAAKQVTDDCLDGKSPKVKCPCSSDAERLMSALNTHGFEARIHPDTPS